MEEVVIASAVRLATGRFLGSLRSFSAPQLGAHAVREAVRRAGIEPALVTDCIMGNVVSAGIGQAPARQAALRGGLSDTTGAFTVNMVCGSGLQAVCLAAHAIACGDAGIVVAGGMESMSRAPYLLPQVREGVRMGHARAVDAVVHDGLWCAFEDRHMGAAAEFVASEYGVSREAQDRYALESHRRAAAAIAAGAFADEIHPIDAPAGKGEVVRFDRDESVRPDADLESLARLRPAFDPGGTVTSGNAPPLSDGAATLLLLSSRRARELGVTPLARVVGQATSGVAPLRVLMSPVPAVTRLLSRVGWRRQEVDLFEINEAFAAQMVAVLRELDLDPAVVNVNGGAIALGHPIGASGARVLTTLVHSLRAHGKARGVAALCLGGGNGVALAIERLA